MLLGIIGFGVTIWQLLQVKRVADAQRDAIAGLKVRLAQFDVIQECAKAEAALAEIRKCLLISNTEISLQLFDALATSFVSILEGSHAITEDVRERLRSAVEEITKLTEMSPRVRNSAAAPAKRAATIRDYHGIIVKIRAQVQEDQTHE